MYKKTWDECYPSICSLNFFDKDNQKIGSGTGFKINKHIVTNNHVYAAPNANRVELKFVNEDGYTEKCSKIISYEEFQKRLQIGMPEDSWDYAILDLNDEEFKDIPSLKLADSSSVKIGQDIAVLGFQFDQKNLSIKRGILSSKFIRSNVKYLQIDASVNQGNSGGPLINIDSNEVIGIITRKYTGLSKVFDNLIGSFDNNITALKMTMGVMRIGIIDPMHAMVMTQEQMKITAIEIKRSSNVGIGYAYELEQIKDFFDNL